MATEAVAPANPFDPAAVAPETAEFNAKLEALLATAPNPFAMPPQEAREQAESGKGLFGPVVHSDLASEREIAGVPCRVLLPETVRGVYLHIHGGGWTLGRAHLSDAQNERTARRANVAVISIDYRLAPEHPYPAAPDDCEAVAAWLAQHAQAEFGSERLVIGGESAGAHLAVVTLLRLRDRHGWRGFRGANLFYGCYDFSMTPSQIRWGQRYLVLSGESLRNASNNFVPNVSQRRDPDVSPLYADLAGLPPALFSVGTLDPLLDDSLFMHARWLAADNQAELAIYPGAVHGFNAFPIQVARDANARAYAFIVRTAQAAQAAQTNAGAR